MDNISGMPNSGVISIEQRTNQPTVRTPILLNYLIGILKNEGKKL